MKRKSFVIILAILFLLLAFGLSYALKNKLFESNKISEGDVNIKQKDEINKEKSDKEKKIVVDKGLKKDDKVKKEDNMKYNKFADNNFSENDLDTDMDIRPVEPGEFPIEHDGGINDDTSKGETEVGEVDKKEEHNSEDNSEKKNDDNPPIDQEEIDKEDLSKILAIFTKNYRLNEGLVFNAKNKNVLPSEVYIGLKSTGENDGELHKISWSGDQIQDVKDNKPGKYQLKVEVLDDFKIADKEYEKVSFFVDVLIK